MFFTKMIECKTPWAFGELGAVPVSGPAVDGCRQYFFRRADIC